MTNLNEKYGDLVSVKEQNLTVFNVMTEIGFIEQLARMRLEQQLPKGLRISQFCVLNHFARLGGEQTPAELVRAFQVTKGAMTNTVQRLEARGLVEVTPHPRDGRSKRIRLTAAGYHLRNEGIGALTPVIQELEDEFSIQEFEAALPFLERLRAFLDAARNTPLALSACASINQ